MSDLKSEVGYMADDLDSENGEPATYRRGAVSQSVTLVITRGASYTVDNGQGGLIEIQPVSAILPTASLPYGDPRQGDKIQVGDEMFEVQPTVGEKVFRRISPQMTRIHLKQVAN